MQRSERTNLIQNGLLRIALGNSHKDRSHKDRSQYQLLTCVDHVPLWTRKALGCKRLLLFPAPFTLCSLLFSQLIPGGCAILYLSLNDIQGVRQVSRPWPFRS